MGDSSQANKLSPTDTSASPESCPLGEHDCPIYNHIQQLESRIAELTEQVNTDSLTGLYNRKHFNESMAQELERTQRSRQPTSLALIDLDHFKAVNDTHGHIAGDEVLKAVAKAIGNTIRKLDIACRYGGEEIAVIFPSTYQLVASQVAERLRQAIENCTVSHGSSTIPITASIGVDTYTAQSKETAAQFIERVDQLLYDAKHLGRNRVATRTFSSEKDPSHVSSAEKSALFDDE